MKSLLFKCLGFPYLIKVEQKFTYSFTSHEYPMWYCHVDVQFSNVVVNAFYNASTLNICFTFITIDQ
jgi:hypothetical protein